MCFNPHPVIAHWATATFPTGSVARCFKVRFRDPDHEEQNKNRQISKNGETTDTDACLSLRESAASQRGRGSRASGEVVEQAKRLQF